MSVSIPLNRVKVSITCFAWGVAAGALVSIPLNRVKVSIKLERG